jgi:hypothetical protein
MKKQILILLSVFIITCFPAISQPILKSQLPEILTSENAKLKSVVYQNYSKMGMTEKERYTFFYSDTLNTILRQALSSSSSFENRSKEDQYLSNGLVYQSIQYYWRNNNWENYGGFRYEYDMYGNVIKERRYEKAWLLESRKSIEIKDNGDTLSISYEEFLNGDTTKIICKEDITYEYNSYGLISEKIIETEYNQSGKTLRRTVFFYDDDLNLIREEYYNSKDQLSRTEEYTYDEENKLTEAVRYLLNDKTNKLEQYWMNKYNYDEFGNMIINSDHIWDDNKFEWNIIRKIEWDYDAIGNMLEIALYNKAGDQLQYSQKTTYEYDNKKRVKLNYYSWDIDEWKHQHFYEYFYNEAGDTTYIKLYYPAPIALQNNRRSSYTYNDDGLVSNIEEYLWYQSEWVKDFNYDFSYYENGFLKTEFRKGKKPNSNTVDDKYEYYYNEKGDTLEIIKEEDHASPNSKKYHYTFDYDEENIVITKTYAQWVEYFWYNNYRLVQNFNHFGEKDSVLKQIYSGGEWMDEKKYIYEYDNEQRLLTNSHYQYSWTEEGLGIAL